MATTFFKSSRVLFLFLVICSALPSKAQKIDSVRVFLDSALNIMERKSIYGQDLNWKVIKDSAHQLAKDAATYQEAGPALKFAFNLLRDKHGWLTLNGEHYGNPFMLHDNSRINESTKAALSKPAMRFRSQVVAKKYAYLSIPFFGGQTAEGMNKFAQQVQDSLCKVMGPSIKGIIIDLRLNGGGNVFPMIVGISNVLGDGRFTASVNAAGETEP